MPSFTHSQKKAHDPNRHISISANAGSGKTSVLVSRYCDLLELHGYEPSDIAAVTFTEKAAAELRVRIAREIESRLTDASYSSSWERLKRVRERLPSASIGTIHGFCGNLLREFPVEFDTSPTFRIVSGYERVDLVESAIASAIETALAEVPAPEWTGTYDTARRLGRESFEQLLRLLLNEREKRRLASTFSDTVSQSGPTNSDGDSPEADQVAAQEATIRQWMRHLTTAVRSLTLNAETRPAIDHLIAALRPEKQPAAFTLLSEAEQAADSDAYVSSFTELVSKTLLTAKFEIRKRNYDLESNDFDDLVGSAKRLKRRFRDISGLLASDFSEETHRRMLDDTEEVLRVARYAEAYYEQRKEELNMLDFEDLQLRVLDHLERPDVAENVSGRFRYLMVDEFQDTNQLQYRIVRLLARELVGGELLCIVGDPKQSIYGFRGAEVEVFAEATSDIMAANRDAGRADQPLLYRQETIPPSGRDEGLGKLAIEASFRLLPAICAYANAACAPIMQVGRESLPSYDDLVCARRSDGLGAVEFLLATDEEIEGDGHQHETPTSEAELVARRIEQLIGKKESIVWERSEGDDPEQPRPVRYADIAVLCRKRSTFEAIEHQLRIHDIPFATSGGFGYFATQEIYDVTNYLKVVMNRRDDVALLGLLRSPFFAVDDAELYSLSRRSAPKGADLWDRISLACKEENASDALVRATAAIDEDRAMAGRLPVSLLVKRLVEQTGWRGAVIGAQRGEQILANVDKLVDLARSFERRGFTNLFDFIEQLEARIEAEDKESEADLFSERDAVRLMTMHGAKGLEFPVVILPSLESPPRTASAPYLDKDFGLGYTWTFNSTEHRPGVTELMGIRQRRREKQEEARLFYVAVTRARDMLVLSGTLDKKGEVKEGTMLDWALAPLGGVPESDRAEQEDISSLRQTLRTRLPYLSSNGDAIEYRPIEQSIATHRSIDAHAGDNIGGVAPTALDSRHLRVGTLPARARGEIFGATAYLAYRNCPTRYYLRYRLGIPETIGEAFIGDLEERATSEDGLLLSRLFRRAVVEIDAVAGHVIGRDQSQALAELVERVIDLEALPTDIRRKYGEQLLRLLAPLCELADVRDICAIGSDDVRTEQELRIALPRDGADEFIVGVIDRVIVTDDRVRFVQFRTLRLRDRDPAAIAASYLPQLRLYAWLLSRRFPDLPSIDATLFFADRPDLAQTFTFGSFDLLRFEDELRVAISDIHGLSYTPERELPSSTEHCPLCPYFLDKTCLLIHNGRPLA